MTGFTAPTVAVADSLQWSEACVAIALDDNRFLLDDGRLARQALSCLVTPEAGDRVLAAASALGEHYVVHVLARAAGAAVRLEAPGADELRIVQPRIALQATDEIALRSLRGVEVTAATGVLALNANNLHCTVNESLVESMRNYVGQADQYLLEAAGLLRLQGEHAMLLAERDVKVDAERISVG
jgi:hypothetical protein